MAVTPMISSASPPPYGLLLSREELPPGHDTQQDTLKCIFITLSRERSLPCPGRALDGVITLLSSDVQEETRRMRSFMLYTIDVDYDCRGGYILGDEDRTHFFRLGRWLLSLYQEKTQAERKKRLPRYCSDFNLWLLRAIYAPAYALDLPIDVFVVALVRFVRSICLHATYQSCIQDVLRGDGLDRLAEKLFFDQHEVLKCFEGDANVRVAFKCAMEAEMRKHVEQVGPKKGGRQWRDLDFAKHDAPRV